MRKRLKIQAMAVILLAGMALLSAPKQAMANDDEWICAHPMQSGCWHTCIDAVWELSCPEGAAVNCNYFTWCPNECFVQASCGYE